MSSFNTFAMTKKRYIIKDVKIIYKKAKQNDSWVGSRILPLVYAKLSFQTMAIIEKKIEFKIISNVIVIISSVKNYKIYKN